MPSRKHLFDIGLLARRTSDTVHWLAQGLAQGPAQAQRARQLPIGFFGASKGAAGALIAAADNPGLVCAVVSRGGRPDLAGEAIARVQAPTLLTVGGRDQQVIVLNRGAQQAFHAECRLEIVPGATHLFAEPGALEQVTRLASDWLLRHLPEQAASATG